MALRHLSLRDFVIVAALDLALADGFTALTGETGAGKSILIDALQLVLGGRGDALWVREGQPRCDIAAEFELPDAARPWLAEHGFDTDADALLLRRTIDAAGKSRAWINGSPATLAQLRTLGEWLVDIHGQHAWQSLTRAAAVRQLLDAYAGIDTGPLADAWQAWRQAEVALAAARAAQDSLAQERERLLWQIGELDKLAPGDGEWDELNQRHARLSHAQALIDAARAAGAALEGDDGDSGALPALAQAHDALAGIVLHGEHDAVLGRLALGAMAERAFHLEGEIALRFSLRSGVEAQVVATSRADARAREDGCLAMWARAGGVRDLAARLEHRWRRGVSRAPLPSAESARPRAVHRACWTTARCLTPHSSAVSPSSV